MPKNVRYAFVLPDDSQHEFTFTLNTETFEIETGDEATRPHWTELGFCQCANCPLTDVSHCPVAVNICNIVLPMGSLISYETVTCRVVTQERTTMTTTSAQDAIRSLMPFVVATSSCPHTDFLKPMARFHLPFPTLEEVVSRIVSTYLLFQYFRRENGEVFDQGLDGLFQICENFEAIALAMAARLKAGDLEGDAGINALVIIHNLTQFMPLLLDKHLDIIRPAFEPLLRHYGSGSRSDTGERA
jgi:hypothetical protein